MIEKGFKPLWPSLPALPIPLAQFASGCVKPTRLRFSFRHSITNWSTSRESNPSQRLSANRTRRYRNPACLPLHHWWIKSFLSILQIFTLLDISGSLGILLKTNQPISNLPFTRKDVSAAVVIERRSFSIPIMFVDKYLKVLEMLRKLVRCLFYDGFFLWGHHKFTASKNL